MSVLNVANTTEIRVCSTHFDNTDKMLRQALRALLFLKGLSIQISVCMESLSGRQPWQTSQTCNQ